MDTHISSYFSKRIQKMDIKTIRKLRVPMILHFWDKYYRKGEKVDALNQFLIYLIVDMMALVAIGKVTKDIVIHHAISFAGVYQTIHHPKLERLRDYMLAPEITVVLNGFYTMSPHKIWNVFNMLGLVPFRFMIWRKVDDILDEELDQEKEDKVMYKVLKGVVKTFHMLDFVWFKDYLKLVKK